MREKIAELAEKFIQLEIIALAFLLPLFFIPITVEFYEFNKLILLTFATGLGATAWALKVALTGNWGVRKSPFDLPVLFSWIATLVSTIFSDNQLTSVIGQYARWIPSLHSATVLTTFYFLVSWHIDEKTLKRALRALLAAATLGALLFLPQYFGLNLFGQDWSNRATFTPLGSTAVLSVFLGAVAGMLWKELLAAKNRGLKIALAADFALFAATLALMGSGPGWIAFAASVLATVFTSPIELLGKSKSYLAGSLTAALVLAIAVLIPPLFGKSTFLNREFPKEVTLDLSTSWSVAATSFRQKPLWGSGPSTFISDFTRFKPLRFNQTNLWNIRFDRPLNEYLLAFAEEGLIGVIAWILMITIIVREAIRRRGWETLPLAVAVVLGYFLTNATVLTSMLLLLALGTVEPRMGTGAGAPAERKVGGKHALPLLVIVILGALEFGGLYRAYAGEYWQRNSRTSDSLAQVYESQVKSVEAFPWQIAHRIALSQTNFLTANGLAKKEKPTEEDKQQVKQLIAQSLSEGRAAADLNPLNAGSWENLAQLYRSLIGLAKDAERWSADSYQKAVGLDLFNPLLRIGFGGLYYQLAQYTLAAEQFKAAVNLKPDYANAHYNLGRTYKELGEKELAIQSLETALRLSDPSVEGYEEAKKILDELKAK
ncbi:MAG: tetratricopeptide repeat protein [Patescibacteria group bacterium]